jgi:hypothetical protein
LGSVLTSSVQVTNGQLHLGRVSLLQPLVLIVFVVALAVCVVPLLELFVPRTRGAIRSRLRRRGRLRAAANAEARARALMSELCPDGWRAQITLFGTGEELPPDAPTGVGARVALDWTELEGVGGRAAVMRRVWAPTIREALEAMVADRRTDETLEQIERGAVADGSWWPDL